MGAGPPLILGDGDGIVKGAAERAILSRMNGPDAHDERILRRIPLEILGLSAVLALAAWPLFDAPTALLFFAGGGLAALGFLWLTQSVSRFLLRDRARALRAAVLLYSLRLVLICGVFFIIILLFPKKILAFGAGFSTIVPVFLAEGVGALLRLKTWKA
jgi:hypothetical protein